MPLTPPYPFLNCSRLSRILILSSLLFSAIHTPAQQIPLKPVTLQLKWKHQFQFAGYYLALERGYYRKAGLAVTIVEGGPELDVVDEVLAGRADFGVGTGDLLVEYAKGAPVVVLGVIYQHAPLTMIVFTGPEVHSLRDLAGKPVMIEEGSSSLMAMLEMEE